MKLKSDGPSGNSDTGPVTTTPTGLPCDIAQVLASLDGQCTSCHSSPPAKGVPMSLVSYADLTAPSPSDPTKTNAQAALARMQDTKDPMPPSPLSMFQTEIATFQAWVDAGMPQADCSNLPPPPPPSIYDTPVQCSSNTHWTRGDDGSRSMKPGGACVSCHQMSGGEAPTLSMGGTVYRTAHEPNDCNGTATSSASNPLEVQILDASGNVTLTVAVNSVGNFFAELPPPLPMPFTAKVVDTVTLKSRVMKAAQKSGDCNACHTETGTTTVTGADPAPGRIMAP